LLVRYRLHDTVEKAAPPPVALVVVEELLDARRVAKQRVNRAQGLHKVNDNHHDHPPNGDGLGAEARRQVE
jgi:hypothetical protein